MKKAIAESREMEVEYKEEKGRDVKKDDDVSPHSRREQCSPHTYCGAPK
jgi:hypothetical protein